LLTFGSTEQGMYNGENLWLANNFVGLLCLIGGDLKVDMELASDSLMMT
jgi:hypothetical protein